MLACTRISRHLRQNDRFLSREKGSHVCDPQAFGPPSHPLCDGVGGIGVIMTLVTKDATDFQQYDRALSLSLSLLLACWGVEDKEARSPPLCATALRLSSFSVLSACEGLELWRCITTLTLASPPIRFRHAPLVLKEKSPKHVV